MRIGVFGSYDRMNFGDDLLAFYISEGIKNIIGAEVIVLSSSEQFILPDGIRRTDSIEEFVDKSDYLVLGGGGFLTKSYDRILEETLLKLIDLAEKKSIPLYIISIGGDQCSANEVNDYLGSGRKRLFAYPFLKGGTVRTKEEYVDFDLVEDILWNGKDLIDYKRQENKKDVYTIGLHLSAHPLLKRVCHFVEAISALFVKEIRFVYFQTHDVKVNHIKELGPFLSRNSFVVYEGGVVTFFERLSEVDILISAKMHVGLLCLSMRKPFVSFGGPTKAKNLLIRLGLPQNIMSSSPRRLGIFLMKLVFCKSFRENWAKCIPSDEDLRLLETSARKNVVSLKAFV